MVLRCADCRTSVTVDLDAPESWRHPLWDHLLDHHRDRVAAGTHTDIVFAGQGVRCRVTETHPAPA